MKNCMYIYIIILKGYIFEKILQFEKYLPLKAFFFINFIILLFCIFLPFQNLLSLFSNKKTYKVAFTGINEFLRN